MLVKYYGFVDLLMMNIGNFLLIVFVVVILVSFVLLCLLFIYFLDFKCKVLLGRVW